MVVVELTAAARQASASWFAGGDEGTEYVTVPLRESATVSEAWEAGRSAVDDAADSGVSLIACAAGTRTEPTGALAAIGILGHHTPEDVLGIPDGSGGGSWDFAASEFFPPASTVAAADGDGTGGPAATTGDISAEASRSAAGPTDNVADDMLRAERLRGDNLWMDRCGRVRDAMFAARRCVDDPSSLLAELDDPALTCVTALALAAAGRGVPVMVGGIVGAAATMIARRMSPRSSEWWWPASTSGAEAERLAWGELGRRPLLDIGMSGEGGLSALLALSLAESAGRLTTLPSPADRDASTD
jgi:hypothetical protein